VIKQAEIESTGALNIWGNLECTLNQETDDKMVIYYPGNFSDAKLLHKKSIHQSSRLKW